MQITCVAKISIAFGYVIQPLFITLMALTKMMREGRNLLPSIDSQTSMGWGFTVLSKVASIAMV